MMHSLGNFAYEGRPIPEQIFGIHWERGIVGDLRSDPAVSVLNLSDKYMLKSKFQA